MGRSVFHTILHISLLGGICLIFYFPAKINAQYNNRDGQDLLKRIELAFERGRFDSVNVVLDRIRLNRISSARVRRELRIYYILSSLEQDEFDKADQGMRKLLQDFPNYVPGPNDSEKIKRVYYKFKRFPVISLGPCVWVHSGNIRLIARNPIRLGTNADYNQKYFSQYNTGYGLLLQTQISPSFRVNLGFDVTNVSWGFRYSSLTYGNIFQVSLTETDQFLDLPVNFTYVKQLFANSDQKAKGYGLHVTVSAGADLRRLLSATQSYSWSQATDSALSVVGDTVSQTGVLVKNRRQEYSVGLRLGAGVEYHFGAGHFFLNFASQIGVGTFSKSNYWDVVSSTVFWDYHVMDAKFGLNQNVMFSAGFLFHLRQGIKKIK